MDKAEETKVKVVYRRTADYRVLPVSGALGTITPQGLLVCNIYVDLNRPVLSSNLTKGPDNTPVEEFLHDEAIIREQVVGLLMTPEIALSLAGFFKRMGERIIDARDKPEGDVEQ